MAGGRQPRRRLPTGRPRRGSRPTRDRRFFVYVHYREPHFPYDPEPPFDTKCGPDGPIPKAARRDMGFFREINQGRRPFSEEEQAHLVRLYDGNLAYVDREVGALQAGPRGGRGLGRDGLHPDRGPRRGALGARLDRPQRPGLRAERAHPAHRAVPGRGGTARASASRRLVDLVDIAPTVADVFGVRDEGGADREFQGRSLLPVIAGAPGRPARRLPDGLGAPALRAARRSLDVSSTTPPPARRSSSTPTPTPARRRTWPPSTRSGPPTFARRCSSGCGSVFRPGATAAAPDVDEPGRVRGPEGPRIPLRRPGLSGGLMTPAFPSPCVRTGSAGRRRGRAQAAEQRGDARRRWREWSSSPHSRHV